VWQHPTVSELEWSTTPGDGADAAAPGLRRPLVVLAFRGLFDAGDAATTAVEWLVGRHDGRRLARIDPEGFFDFQQQRPLVQVTPSGGREILWPYNDFVGITSNGTRDLVLCAGYEPHLRWRTFGSYVVDVVRRYDAEMVVTLGSMVGLVPHTRPLPVTGSAANPDLARRLGLDSPSYEGPTGVVGTLHDMLDAQDIPVISLRVAVPHYVPAPPNPKATATLLRRFEQVTGIPTAYRELEPAGNDWQQQVSTVAADDPQVVGYVRRLEEQYDEEAPLPSGDDLAAELEAFLRDQRDDG
jgi:proteasome assembly chaperone (PAC2) family protein